MAFLQRGCTVDVLRSAQSLMTGQQIAFALCASNCCFQFDAGPMFCLDWQRAHRHYLVHKPVPACSLLQEQGC